MILHSVLPPEAVFPECRKDAYEYKPFQNGYIQCRHSGDGYTVSRLISTDPRLYLDARFTPGEKLKM